MPGKANRRKPTAVIVGPITSGSFERFGGYAASLSTGLLGFLQILWDRNRQGLHDKAAGSLVGHSPGP